MESNSEKQYMPDQRSYYYLNNNGKKFRFGCSCGKIYQAFPSLYFHCQKVHKIKISVKPLAKEHEITRVDNNVVITYLYERFSKQILKPRIKSQTNNFQDDSQLTIEEVIELFIRWGKDEKTQDLFLKRSAQNTIIFSLVMKKFGSFVKSKKGEGNLEKSIRYLPYYFNSFIAKLTEEEKDINLYAKACTMLLFFAKWLQQYHYTDLEVKCVSQFEEINNYLQQQKCEKSHETKEK